MPPLILASTTSHKREPLLMTLDVFGRLGLRDVDLNLHHVIEGGVPVGSVEQAVSRHDLRLHVVSGGWCDFFDRVPRIDETLRSVARQVELARGLGVSVVRLFFGRLPLDQYGAPALATVSENLQRISDLYPSILFVFENHDGASRRPEVCGEILERTNRPNIRMNFDPINFERDGVRHQDAFEILKPFIAHLHLKGLAERQFAEFGVGDVDLTPMLEALAARRYQGKMSVEYEGVHDGTLRLYRSVLRARSSLDAVFGGPRSD
jgi:sugar phosphate isomerase/epimerase